MAFSGSNPGGLSDKESTRLITPTVIFLLHTGQIPLFFLVSSGFDSIEECFEEESKHISAIETGLSSDPSMNWRWSKLDNITLISNSDAHSPSKIGREANVFDCELSYQEIIKAIKNKDKKKFL